MKRNEGLMKNKKIKLVILTICAVWAVIISGCTKQVSSNSANINSIKSFAKDANEDAVIAYYFHRNIRCAGCLKIEANAKRVIEKNFAKEIADKKLMWAPFNLDEPGGEEFAKEFDISIGTLVLSKTKKDNQSEYKKLEKAWELMHERNAFDTYVKDEVKQFLNE